MHRFYFEECSADGMALLDAEESRHAAQVLRLHPGEEVVLLNGWGGVFSAVLEEVSSARVTARIGTELENREPSVSITLYQGMPKADKLEWILQKGTELGITAFCPVLFSRCVRDGGKNPEKNLARWNRIVRDAAKQCGRGVIPKVEAPITEKELLSRIHSHTLALTAWEDAKNTRIAQVLGNAADVALIIGPEGGISEQEEARLTEAGARTVTLGKRILRTETAPLAAAASILTITEEL